MRTAFTAAVFMTVGQIAAPLAALAADGADVQVVPRKARPVVVDAGPPIIAAPLQVPTPTIAYGCQKIWRCDTVICEWRRGCNGIYGYMEGPYFSQPLAKRQWESHGLITPAKERTR